MRRLIKVKASIIFCSVLLSSMGFSQGLKSNTNLYVETGAVLYADDMSNDASGTIHNSGEIRLTGNFNNSGTSNVDELVVLEGTGAQSVTGVSDFQDILEVNKTTGTATVTSGTTNIHGQLRLAEGTMNANGNLVIASTASGTGLVDDFSVPTYNGTLSGNLRVQRYVSGIGGIRYIGSAVNTANLTELSELSLYGPNMGQIVPLSNCNPNAIDQSSPYGNMFEWHEEGSWLVSGCLQSGWFVRSSGNMTNARGYAARTGGTFEIGGGVGNTSEISTVSYSGLSNTNSTGNGWHLVSNPFPSPMQWFAAPSGFDGQAHFWQPIGAYQGTYQAIIPMRPTVQ